MKSAWREHKPRAYMYTHHVRIDINGGIQSNEWVYDLRLQVVPMIATLYAGILNRRSCNIHTIQKYKTLGPT